MGIGAAKYHGDEQAPIYGSRILRSTLSDRLSLGIFLETFGFGAIGNLR